MCEYGNWGERREGEALREFDLNTVNYQMKGNSEMTKKGVWKRRGSRQRNVGRKMGGAENESGDSMKEAKGKRGFCLVDKEGSERQTNSNVKKVKMGVENMIICDKEVEVANHKWL